MPLPGHFVGCGEPLNRAREVIYRLTLETKVERAHIPIVLCDIGL